MLVKIAMNSSIELIRIISVVLITFTHTRNELTDGFLYFIIEKLPTYGTAILSIVSGYLYFTVSRSKDNLLKKKFKSLAIPYLIANAGVLVLVLVLNYAFGYNSLNRLEYDYKIITEGVMALNSVPINPPTYFIRDIFIIFTIIELFTKRNYYTLLILIPLLLFGTLFLRIDVVILFVLGCAYAKYKNQISKPIILVSLLIISIFLSLYYSEYLKFAIALLFFVSLIDLKFRIGSTGRYSYLLHLYHSPIIVISYPLINKFIQDPVLNIILQILSALLATYCLYLLTKKVNFLKILSGGR